MTRWTRPGTPLTPPPPGLHAPAPWADLYACWAQATGWRGFRRAAGTGAATDKAAPPSGPLRIIVRVEGEGPGFSQRLHNALHCTHWTVPPVYKHELPGGGGATARHFTATVPQGNLGWLATNTLGITWELAVPLRQAQNTLQADTTGRFGRQRSEQSMRAALLPRRPRRPRSRARAALPAPALLAEAIAVIDFGCPFLNLRFSDGDEQTRVAALWDQDERPGQLPDAWWHQPPDTHYGRELDSNALSALFLQAHPPGGSPGTDEARLYRQLDYLRAYDDPRRRVWHATHGAHVLDMAGGRHDPLRPLLVAGDRPLLRDPPADAAGQAPLVFVQLPALTAADSSGGSLSAQLLDGVRYVLARCTPEAPVVVNISYGTFAGPHNGSSLIETALDELLRLRKDNFAIVLGAGNARDAGCHMRRTVAKNRCALLHFGLAPGDTTDTFVELWYPRPKRGQPWLQARVRTAGGDWSEWAPPGAKQTLFDPATGDVAALLQHAHQVPHGSQAMLLLAMAPTAHAMNDEGPLSEVGTWEIEVAFVDAHLPADDATVVLNAWVERDDPGDGGGAQPRFMAVDQSDDENTLSSIATGTHTVVVGAWQLQEGTAAPYSSLPAADAQRRALPLVYGLAEESREWPHVAAAAVRSPDLHRMNGTSVAAPVLARRLFNAMKHSGPIARDGWPKVLAALANDDPAVKLP